MKLRSLVGWALCGMTVSCVTVYAATEPDAAAPVNQAARADASATDASEVVPYAAPSAAAAARVEDMVKLESRVGHSSLRANGVRETFLMLEVEGGKRQGQAHVPSSTALVIDRSGSMRGERMRRAVQAARGWVSRAAAQDRISLLAFNEHATQLVPSMQLSVDGRATVNQALSRLSADGGTCVSCGLTSAMEQLAVGSDDRVRRVVLLSDGQANSGIQDAAGMRSLARRCRDRGVSVTTVGVGANYNEKMLASLSFESNGNHHFVAQASDLPALFERERESLRATVAAGVEAHVELADGVVLTQVFARSTVPRGNATMVPLGPLSEGERKTVLMKVQVPANLGTRPLASVSLRFVDPVSQASRQSAVEQLATNVTASPDSELDAMVEMRLQRHLTVVSLETAGGFFQRGNRAAALRELDERTRILNAVVGRADFAGGDTRVVQARADMQQQLRDIREARAKFAVTRARDVEGRRAVRSMRHRMFVHSL